MPKMKGLFCERTETGKEAFARGSFRSKQVNKHWVITACPKGHWMPRKQWCKVGTMAHKILRKVRKGQRCRKSEKRIKKG